MDYLGPARNRSIAKTLSAIFPLYLKGKCPVVIAVKEEGVEDGGEGGVPHVDQEGGQELHHGRELKAKVMLCATESKSKNIAV